MNMGERNPSAPENKNALTIADGGVLDVRWVHDVQWTSALHGPK